MNKLRNWLWAILGAGALALRWVAGQFPEITEQFYSNGIFIGIRSIIDWTLGKLAFPSVYFFFLFVFGVIILYFWKLRKLKSRGAKLGYSIQALANGLGSIAFFFLVLWGFNYQRTNVSERLSLAVAPLPLEVVQNEIEIVQLKATELRRSIKQDTLPIVEPMPYLELEAEVREVMKDQLEKLRLVYAGEPRTRLFPPDGLMRRLGILGIYWPFTGESYIDPSLHPLEKPFTIAHEMAHSFGVTDEGEANFVAWVVASESNFTRLNYAAQLRLMIYLMRDYASMDPEGYREWTKTLDRGIVNDILSIRENANRYEPISIEFSRAANDAFLKTQGVKEGVKSYQQMPMLVYAWKNR